MLINSLLSFLVSTPVEVKMGSNAISLNLTLPRKQEKTHQNLCDFDGFLVAGVGFEPHDLRVMSPTSYQAAPPRDMVPEAGIEPVRDCSHGILSPGRLPIPPFRHSSDLCRPYIITSQRHFVNPFWGTFFCSPAASSIILLTFSHFYAILSKDFRAPPKVSTRRSRKEYG